MMPIKIVDGTHKDEIYGNKLIILHVKRTSTNHITLQHQICFNVFSFSLLKFPWRPMQYTGIGFTTRDSNDRQTPVKLNDCTISRALLNGVPIALRY